MPARALALLLVLPLAQDAPRPNTAVATDLFDAYASGGQVDAAVANARKANGFILLLKDAAPAWIDAVPGETRKRRLIVASAVLEVVAVDLRARPAQQTLIPWAASLLAQDAPSDGERVWHRAANALVQRTADPFFVNFSAQGAARFPADERLQLARALSRERASWPAVQNEQRSNRKAGAAILQSLATEFEALTSRSPIEAEVRLRLGHTYLRLDRHADAWNQFTRVEPLTDDPFVEYLSRYLSGRARLAMGDAPGAAAAFRSALELSPRAQSASLALASVLFRGEDPAQAGVLVQASIAGAERPADPWRTYQDADYRFWPELVTLLRKQVR